MNDSIEGPRRSKLTFVASCDSHGSRVEVGQLRRVREPVSRSKSGVQGKVADVASGRSRHAESQNELRAFQILLASGHADAWQEQPFILEYHHDGKRHRYTPDILVAWGTNREVVEIKEDSEADKPENRARFAMVRDLLAEHGYSFRVWTHSEIYAEPRLANVGLVLRYRCVDVPAAEREKIRRVFSSGAEPSSAYSERHPRNDSGRRASPRPRWHSSHRLVGASPPGFQSERDTYRPADLARSPRLPIAGGTMSLSTLRKGQRIKVGTSEFLILQKLPDSRWQLQNCATGEWSALSEDDLLDGFAQGDVSFIVDAQARADGLPAKVARDLSAYPPELVALAKNSRAVFERDRSAAAHCYHQDEHGAAHSFSIGAHQG